MQKNTNLNNIDLAITNFNKVLCINPHNPDLYNNLACLYYRMNQIDDAIYNYKRALYLNPNNWQTHYNLANCYINKNFIPDAVSHYKFSIELYPDNINAIQNLGMVLVNLEDFTEALPYLEKSYNANPENQISIEFLEHFANCYLQTGNILKATELLQQAIKLNPSKESLQHNPNNQTAKHMLAALTKETTSQAPPEYIADLFDQYAGYYNKHLKETLQYKLPEKLRSIYTKYNNNSITVQNTLDLGCGTGLCGIYFRDATVNLIGVDLSKNMLHQARSLEAYDLLIQANIQKSNVFQDNYFDLIIAADIIPYIGELENLFLNIKTMLKNKFLFNIELTENALFELQQTGRYAHSKNYIEQLAEKFNFKIIEGLPEIIRLQNNIPINGMIFLLVNVS